MEPVNIPLEADSDAKVPSYAHEGDAAVDLRSTQDLVIHPFQRVLIPTGLKMAIPQGFGGFVLPRSGLAIKQGLSIVNAPGLIDSNYRGEVKVVAINLDSENDIQIHAGDRIAQLLVLPVPTMCFQPVDALDATERGVGGFGSSGLQ